jgi:hypothetical protein
MTLPLKNRGFTLTERFVHDIFLHLDDVSPYILGFDFVAMIECILHPDQDNLLNGIGNKIVRK